MFASRLAPQVEAQAGREEMNSLCLSKLQLQTVLRPLVGDCAMASASTQCRQGIGPTAPHLPVAGFAPPAEKGAVVDFPLAWVHTCLHPEELRKSKRNP